MSCLICMMFVGGEMISPSWGHWPWLFFFFSDLGIVSHSHFSWQLSTRLRNCKHVATHKSTIFFDMSCLTCMMFVGGGVISPSWGHWPWLFFFFSDLRIASHSPFSWQLATRLRNCNHVATRFPSSTRGNSSIRISHNSESCTHPMYVCCLLNAWVILSNKPKQKWFVSVYFNFVSEVNRSKEATIDTLFCTSYDSSPHSLMAISLKRSMIFLWLS